MAVELTTGRLLLRGWTTADREPFAVMNADPDVMEHFPSVLSRTESDQLVDRIEKSFAQRGWGLWAVEQLADGAFVGFVGLNQVPFEAEFTPAVEVGWRLARGYWGKGYATEGARAALAYGFGTLALDTVVSFTTPGNVRSQAVMKRIGMTQVGEFDNPRIAEGHELRRHVLYAIAKSEWPGVGKSSERQ